MIIFIAAQKRNITGKGVMRSAKPSGPFEDQKSPDLRLFEFLQRSNAQKEYPTFHRMFNTPFKMSDIVTQYKESLEDEFEVFSQMTADGRIVLQGCCLCAYQGLIPK